ncbi:hypothetical protein J6590_044422 [Homalodisca vitripennis]|nr:hypothetical protein J6590_044422 [Homalodisca vitripennis]
MPSSSVINVAYGKKDVAGIFAGVKYPRHIRRNRIVEYRSPYPCWAALATALTSYTYTGAVGRK